MNLILGKSSHLSFPVNPSDLKTKEKALLMQKCAAYYSDLVAFHDGGYFYNNALHLFSASSTESHENIFARNSLVGSLYENVADKYFFFAEDVFGNLFGFYDAAVVLFSIDSGEIETIAASLEDWYQLITSEPEYYTGFTVLQSGIFADSEKLKEGYRLGAIFPFVLGGDYSPDNLVLLPTFENLKANAVIYAQIAHLPDGTEVTINPVNISQK